MANHVGPYGDANGVIVKSTSDAMFGPDGLGFANTPWTTLISWLARNGISEQTGSKADETIAENCVLGWGQGAYSSRVFAGDGSCDQAQLQRLTTYLSGLAQRLQGDPTRINSVTVAAFIEAQRPQPYRTFNGVREVRGLRERLSSRFRGHIQWQSFVALCGYVNSRGEKVITPSLLRRFFGGESSFFADLVARRRQLGRGEIRPGEALGFFGEVESGIDREETDRAYTQRKSGLWVVLKILFYMVTRKGATQQPLD